MVVYNLHYVKFCFFESGVGGAGEGQKGRKGLKGPDGPDEPDEPDAPDAPDGLRKPTGWRGLGQVYF